VVPGGGVVPGGVAFGSGPPLVGGSGLAIGVGEGVGALLLLQADAHSAKHTTPTRPAADRFDMTWGYLVLRMIAELHPRHIFFSLRIVNRSRKP